MKLSTFLTIKALVCFIFAVVLLLLPAAFVASMGGTAAPETVLFARTVGACLVGIGLISWFGKNAAHSDLRQGILLALFCGDTIGFIVSLLGQFSGAANALGWMDVVIWLLLAAGLGYFRFMKPYSR